MEEDCLFGIKKILADAGIDSTLSEEQERDMYEFLYETTYEVEDVVRLLCLKLFTLENRATKFVVYEKFSEVLNKNEVKSDPWMMHFLFLTYDNWENEVLVEQTLDYWQYTSEENLMTQLNEQEVFKTLIETKGEDFVNALKLKKAFDEEKFYEEINECITELIKPLEENLNKKGVMKKLTEDIKNCFEKEAEKIRGVYK